MESTKEASKLEELKRGGLGQAPRGRVATNQLRGTYDDSGASADAPRTREVRWRSEAEFFDRLAEARLADVQPMRPDVIERYSRAEQRRRYNKEYRFRVLGDLRGKRVLDLGCGEGSNAVLLAKRGARVTGLDISQRSVELADAQARANGVADQTEFFCSPLELATLEESSFDVIWGDGILHHVIPELDDVLTRLTHWAKPGARFVFSEPVCEHPVMRKVRRFVPIHTDATPDERPLMAEELATVRRHLPDLELRYFALLGRFTRLWLKGNYEEASEVRRRFTDAVHALDWAVLGSPGIKTLGGMAVMTGTARRKA